MQPTSYPQVNELLTIISASEISDWDNLIVFSRFR
jgi:hypothetical protein